MSKDTHQAIEDELIEVCDKYGYDYLYVKEYTEAAAVKASVFFQSLGYDYGDRIPSVYKLQDTINELVSCVIKQGKDEATWASTGMFRVSRGVFDGQEEFLISLELCEFPEHRILADE